MKRTTAALAATTLLFATACDDGQAGPTTVAPPLEPVALGVLPDSPTPLAPPVTPSTTPPTTAPVDAVIEPIEGPVGEVAAGNRLLLIGSTEMATVTERQGGVGCAVLAGAGWQVQVEAEVGRFIRFADEVIDTVVVDAGDGWDVIGLMFGLYVDISAEEFGAALDALIERLDGRPVLVYTTAERTDADAAADPVTVALNEQVREVAAARPNVVLIDFADAVNTEQTVTLVDDERVPTTEGMGRIVLLTLAALGPYPPEGGDPAGVDPSEGECLDPVFTDDSAILL